MNEIDKVKNKIKDVQKEINILIDKRKPIDRALKETSDNLSELHIQLDKEMAKAGNYDDIKSLIDNYNPYLSNQRLLINALDKWAASYTLYRDGYNVETKQVAFKLMLKRDGSNIDKTIEGIKIVTKLLKPLSNRFIYFGIFEHTLNEYKSYHLEISKDLKNCVVLDHLREEKYCKGNLKKVIKYISKNLWYE